MTWAPKKDGDGDGDGFGAMIEASSGPDPIIPSRAGPGGWSQPEQSLGLALFAGASAGALGSLVWAFAAVTTGKRIAYLALGIGFVVGWIVRKAGRGSSWPFGAIAGLVTIASCVFGMVLTWALERSMTEGSSLDLATLERLVGVLLTYSLIDGIIASVDAVSVVFTLAGAYQAFQLGYRRPSSESPAPLP